MNCCAHSIPLFVSHFGQLHSPAANIPSTCSHQAHHCPLGDGRYLVWPADRFRQQCGPNIGKWEHGFSAVVNANHHLFVSANGSWTTYYDPTHETSWFCGEQETRFNPTTDITETGIQHKGIGTLTIISLYLTACNFQIAERSTIWGDIIQDPLSTFWALAQHSNLTIALAGSVAHTQPCISLPFGS